MDYTDILIDIRRIVRSLNLESKRIQKEYGISIPQLLCLTYLSTSQNYLATVTDISKYMKLNLSTITGIVDRLEKKGLIARLPRMEDKRIKPIVLTSSGARILDKSPELIHNQLSQKLKKLPEKKLREIQESLQILLEYLEIEEIDASPIITIDDPIISPEDLSQFPLNQADK